MRTLVISFLVLATIFVTTRSLYNPQQLDLKSAAFLVKNSIKELRQSWHKGASGESVLDLNSEYSINSVMNSFFPIDSMIEFNTTQPGENATLHQLFGRYASFSSILGDELTSKYLVLPHNACADVGEGEETESYKDKVLVVLRGGCTFVDKVTRLLEWEPSTIIIANDEPYRGLITMFSNTFNQDGTLETPVMFITNEDYTLLKSFQEDDLTITITTAHLSSWYTIVLSMVFSPPLFIVIFYGIIVCGQRIRKRQINRRNAQMVRDLPVYIYNVNQLVPEQSFAAYLRASGRAESSPSDCANGESLLASRSCSYSMGSASSADGTITGAPPPPPPPDVKKKSNYSTLKSPDGFFTSYKCSICLEKYIPLKSRVLVLDCKHFFHQKCLSTWLINFKRSCPLCNSTLQKSKLLAGQTNYGATWDLEQGVEAEAATPDIGSDVRETTNSREQEESSSSCTQEVATRPTSRPFLITRPSALLSRYNVESEFDRDDLSTSIDSGNNTN
ncbi:uncharacterized protein LODBEIA_P16350 [Lodderomyces beijingensis]|uniref:RING-type domain-containing protein n=1 Tax=Lodderomyces beijingensis TaxID=1775926 RepID=A0ABP0ZKK1_9ASCO